MTDTTERLHTTETDPTPWWVCDNFAPIGDERDEVDLPVEGTIPEALAGTYVRNGFNPPGAVPWHWFFGAGMVHGFDIRDGRVAYRNRYVRTPYLEHDLDLLSAMADPTASPANTNVVRHAGRLLALEEAHLPWALGPSGPGWLDTIGPVDFDGRLTTPMTAHPKLCPETGELLFFGYQFMDPTQPFLTYHRLDAAGELVQSEPIELPRPVMMHDFSITRNHAVFLDLPIVFALDKGGFHFDREAGGRIGLLPREGAGSEVRWFEVEPCTVFHVLNSYERGDDVVVQVCRSSSIMAGGMSDLGDQAVLWQWTIDTVTGAVREEQLDDRPGDFPRVDDRRVGLEARYGYLAGLRPGDHPDFANAVHKYDLETGAVTTHALAGAGDPAAVHTFEPVFAPAGPDAGEDEGWLLVLSHDDASDVTTLNVLDAQDVAAPAVARVHLPRRVPFGAHGNWLAD